MSQQTDHAQARCEDCKKVYRVADPSRTYKCQACGGAVRVAGGPAPPAPRAASPRRRTPAPAAPRDEATVEARHEVLAALKKAYGWITSVTWLYRLGALAYAGMMVAAVFALASTSVPVTGGIVVVVTSALMTIFMLVGAMQVLFKPFVWTVATASLSTLVCLTHFVGPNPLGLALVGSAVCTALLWGALVPTLRVRRLIAEHMDTYILHHASRGTKRALQGRSDEEQHERLIEAMHKAGRRAWKISTAVAVGVAVLAAGGSTFVVKKMRPEDLSLVIADFESKWNGSDLAGVVGFMSPKERERTAVRLAGMSEGNGWGSSLPRLADGSRQEGEDGVRLDYDVGGRTLSTRWAQHGQKWLLLQVEPPIPPLESALDPFRAAWKRSDAAAIAALFPDEHVERMRASIKSSIERRGWNPLPEIQGTERIDRSEVEVEVVLTVADGKLTTKWSFRNDGRWHLHGLQFPKVR